MKNQQLVQFALQESPDNSFKPVDDLRYLNDRLVHISETDREQILSDVRAIVDYSDPWEKIGEKLTWLFKTLQAAAIDAPDGKTENENPQKELAKTLSISAFLLKTNHSKGLDYYDKTPEFVPDVALDTYNMALTTSLEMFKNIEEQKNNYFNSLKNQQDTTNDLKASFKSTEQQLNLITQRKNDINQKLGETEQKIDNLDKERKKLEPDLKKAMKQFEKSVTTAFGLSLNTFFSCLSTLSFMNVHEPVNAVQTLGKVAGYGAAGAMTIGERLCCKKLT
jgi:DNA repair exonuclease SbcCD ATPase subunit